MAKGAQFQIFFYFFIGNTLYYFHFDIEATIARVFQYTKVYLMKCILGRVAL